MYFSGKLYKCLGYFRIFFNLSREPHPENTPLLRRLIHTVLQFTLTLRFISIEKFQFRWTWPVADKTEWGVPTLYPQVTRVQVLVFSQQGNPDCPVLYLLWAVQCASVLANFGYVFYHTILYHHEASDKGKLNP